MAETGPRTVTLTAAMVTRLHEHARKSVNSSDNTAVAAMRDGIQLAVELLRLPRETPIDPNPGLENRLVEVQGLLDDANRGLAELTAELEIANGSYDQMQTDRNRLRTELQQSQRNLAIALDLAGRAPELRNPQPPPPDQVPEVPEENRRGGSSTKYPDAPMFSGLVRTELRPFVTKLRLKLHFNGDRYPTEQDKLAYAVQRLEDLALAQIIPFVEDHRINLDDVTALITILKMLSETRTEPPPRNES